MYCDLCIVIYVLYLCIVIYVLYLCIVKRFVSMYCMYVHVKKSQHNLNRKKLENEEAITQCKNLIHTHTHTHTHRNLNAARQTRGWQPHHPGLTHTNIHSDVHKYVHIYTHIHKPHRNAAGQTNMQQQDGSHMSYGPLPQLDVFQTQNSHVDLGAHATLGKFVLKFDHQGKARLTGLGLKLGAGEREGHYVLRLGEVPAHIYICMYVYVCPIWALERERETMC